MIRRPHLTPEERAAAVLEYERMRAGGASKHEAIARINAALPRGKRVSRASLFRWMRATETPDREA